ncbi:MAG: hypothetical protein V5783_00835 [Pontiella sp.]
MNVICVFDSYKKLRLSDEFYSYVERITQDDIFLTEGQGYVVSAYVFGPFCPWVYIKDNSGLVYPTSYPIHLFEIQDATISKYWKWGAFANRLWDEYPLLAFPEWADDDCFHGKLFNGEKEALSIYRKYADWIERERPLPWIDKVAVSFADDGWVYDEETDDTWEVTGEFAMLRSPSSGELMHNPFYKPDELAHYQKKYKEKK